MTTNNWLDAKELTEAMETAFYAKYKVRYAVDYPDARKAEMNMIFEAIAESVVNHLVAKSQVTLSINDSASGKQVGVKVLGTSQ